MTRKEFNKKVNAEKKRILNGDAEELLKALRWQYLYRDGSILGYSVDYILTEIVQARIVGCTFIESYLIEEYLEDN